MELECDDCGDGFGECVEGSPVVGVKDSPHFEVGDGAFDLVAEGADIVVELFPPVREELSGTLLEWGDHGQAGVALVTEGPVLQAVQDPGRADGRRIVSAPEHGVGDPGQVAVQGAGHLELHAGPVVLARVQLGVIVPGPAEHQGAVDDELGIGIEVVGGGDRTGQDLADEDRVPGDDPGDRGLGDSVVGGEFGLDAVAAQVGQGQADPVEQSQGRRAAPVVAGLGGPGVDEFAQCGDLLAGESRGSMHSEGLFVGIVCSSSIISRAGLPVMFSTALFQVTESSLIQDF